MKITLWTNSTKSADELVELLENRNYEVNRIITGSTVPVLKYGKTYTTGYGRILSEFELM